MLAFAIVRLSRTATGDFMVRIIEDGDVLEWTVKGPNTLFDIEFIHKKFLKVGDDGKPISTDITPHHPKV